MLDVQISISWFGCAVHLDNLNTAILGVSLGQTVHAQRFPAKDDSRSLLEFIIFIQDIRYYPECQGWLQETPIIIFYIYNICIQIHTL